MPLNVFYTMVQKSQKWPKTQIGGGGGGIETKTAHRGQIQVNVIPYRDFSKSKFLIQGGLKEEVWYCFVKRFTIVALPALRQRDLTS